MYLLTHSSFLYNVGKNECNVLHNGLLVWVENPTAFSFVISPCSQEFGGELQIWIAHYISNEGQLEFCNLVLDGGDVKETLPNLCISDSLLLHFCHFYSQNSSFTSVQEYFQLVKEGCAQSPAFTSSEEDIAWDFHKYQILGFEIHWFIIPITWKTAHGSRCGSNRAVHIVVVAEIVWNITSKVFEVPLLMWHFLLWTWWRRCLVSYRIAYLTSDISVSHFLV